MAVSWPWALCHDLIQYSHHLKFNITVSKTRVLHSPPPSITLSSVLNNLTKYKTTQEPPSLLCKNWTNNECASHMASSNFHVASSRPKCFIYTFFYPMAWSGDFPSPCLHASTHTTWSFSGLRESFSSTWNIPNVFGNQQYLCSSPKQWVNSHVSIRKIFQNRRWITCTCILT